MSKIITRAQWGFNGWNGAPKRATPSQFTHRTWHYDGAHPCANQTGAGMMLATHKFHRGPQRGWAGIGYNYLIDSAGNIFEGRGLDFRGAHKPSGPGSNPTGIGIQLHIGGNEKMTSEMIASAVWLSAELDRKTGKKLKDTWHNDGYATSCPGPNVIAWVKAGGPTKRGAASAPAPTVKAGYPAVLVDGALGTETLKAFARYLKVSCPIRAREWTKDEMFVRAFQKWLGRSQTGKWTRSNTRSLQTKLGVTEDGLFGPNTVRALQRFINRRITDGSLK